jgi:hypothetical protein
MLKTNKTPKTKQQNQQEKIFFLKSVVNNRNYSPYELLFKQLSYFFFQNALHPCVMLNVLFMVNWAHVVLQMLLYQTHVYRSYSYMLCPIFYNTGIFIR